jgi:hypothetical protein
MVTMIADVENAADKVAEAPWMEGDGGLGGRSGLTAPFGR